MATAASASVSVNPTSGVGFVGKGDVQSAFGWKNADLQANASAVKFTSSQAASQAMTLTVEQHGTLAGTQSGNQSVNQTLSQTATQAVSEDLSCTVTNGNGTK